MLSFELKQREAKLAREQQARLEVARRKLEEEQRQQERVRKQVADLAEEQRQRRLAAQEAEEALREAHLAQVEANNGVLWQDDLAAIPRDEEAAGARGVRRRADKVLLPPSAQSALLSQDAQKNGPMFFELTTPSGRRTHAGVLEFTALPGTVALPPHTAACLARDPAVEAAAAASDATGVTPEPAPAYSGPLRVRYTRLPKGTFASLQPLWAAFQRDVPDIKAALEAALATHSVLTVGDVVELVHGGARHALRVLELAPEDAVSVIETDLEVHIAVSAEAEAAQAARRRAEEAAAAAAAAAARAAAEAVAAAKAAEAEATARREAAAVEMASHAEPDEAAPGALRVALRLPDGRRAQRRFLASAPLALLFTWADSTPGVLHAVPRGAYALAAAFPRRVLRRGAPGTLAAAGLAAGSQEVLNVEPLAAEDAEAEARG